jgi:glycerol uptake facilitator-like aquaporin
VLAFGGVSGAHVNPAITFGTWTARRIGTLRAISYIAAQLLGGLAAWQLYQYLVDKPVAAKPYISIRAFGLQKWSVLYIGSWLYCCSKPCF